MRPWSWRRSSTRTKLVMEDYRDHTRKQTDLSPTGAVMGGVPGHHAHGFNPSARYGGCKLVGDGTRRHAFMRMPSQDALLYRRSPKHGSPGGSLGTDVGVPGAVYNWASRSDHRTDRRNDPQGAPGGGLRGRANVGLVAIKVLVPMEAALRTLSDFLEDGGDMLDSADLHGGAGDGCSFQDDGRSHGFGEDHVGGAGRRQIRDTVVVSAMECRHAREISGRFKTRAAKFAGKTDQLFSDIKTK